MIKPKGVVLLISSFIVVIIIIFTVLLVFNNGVVVVLLVLWPAFPFLIFGYDKIVINEDSITFDSFGRQRMLDFSEFKNINIVFGGGVVICSDNFNIQVELNSKTKEGLKKIVMLSEKIDNKIELNEKIERWAGYSGV